MIRKYFMIGLLSMGMASLVYAKSSEDPVLFQAKFSSDDVAHQLFQPNSKNVPHPFYTQQCEAGSAPVDYSKATGKAIFSFDPKTHILKYAIAYEGLSGAPIMAHFHFATPKTEGPIVQTICGMPPQNNAALGFSASQLNGHTCPKGNAGFITGSYVIKGNPELKMTAEQEIQELINGNLYINFHTCLNELGEIRGQITKLS